MSFQDASMQVDLEVLLSRADKEEIVKALFIKQYPETLVGRKVHVIYDRRFGWDFEASKRGQSITLTVSVNIMDPRLEFVIEEAVRAVVDLRRSFAVDHLRVSGDRRVEA